MEKGLLGRTRHKHWCGYGNGRPYWDLMIFSQGIGEEVIGNQIKEDFA